MTPETRKQIAECDHFITVVPEGRFDGTEGEEHLRYAIELGKLVIVFRPHDRKVMSIPQLLDGYGNLVIVDGEIELLASTVKLLVRGRDVHLHDGGYEGH